MKMLDRLKALLEVSEASDAPEETPSLALASSMLLFEVVWADHHIGAEELAQMRASLRLALDLSAEEIDAVIEEVQTRQATHVGVFEYTRVINELMSAPQKVRLVTNLWRVAYADGKASAIEEHTIRRMSELLYLPQADYVRAKQRARSSS